MFVQSVLRLVGFSNTVAGAETRAFNVQVPPPSSLRTIPIVELLPVFSFCDPASA